MQVNGIAPGILAEEARRCHAVMIHYSTDYVFSGEKHLPYVESDSTGPLSEYGRTKLEGEKMIAQAGGAYFILRTSWIYSAQGTNFLLTMLRLGTEREQLRVVNDQIGAPTSAGAVTDATVDLVRKLSGRGPNLYDYAQNFAGIYHLSCKGKTSWFEFARSIFAEARETRLGAKLKVAEVVPICTEQYPTPAKRPKYSVLSNEKVMRDLGLSMPLWQNALTTVMRQLVSQQ